MIKVWESDELPAEEAAYIEEITSCRFDLDLGAPEDAAIVIAALCRRLAVVESILRRLPKELL